MGKLEQEIEQISSEFKYRGLALLIKHALEYASQSTPPPIRQSRDISHAIDMALTPEAGKGTHWMGNRGTSLSHEKRGMAASALGSAASGGTGYAVASAAGMTTVAIGVSFATAGIAAGVALLGVLT